MNGVIANSRRGRIKKWLRRALIAGGLLAAAALAVPFVFTSALARYAIAHSDYRGLPLQFGSASLSPWGALTIHNVQITDTAAADKPLVTAGAVRLEFSWRQLCSNHLRMIAVDDLEMTLRPGADVPVSIMRLFSNSNATAAAPPATSRPAATTPAPAADSTASGSAWSVDQFLVVGHVRAEGLEPWLSAAQIHAGQAIPVQLAASVKDAAAGSLYAASFTAGDVDTAAGPSLKARFNVRIAGGVTTINADQITLQNLQPEFTTALAARVPGLPADLRRPTTGSLSQLTVSGAATCGKDISINLAVELHNLTEHLRQADADPLAIENLSASVRIAGKLTTAPLKDLTFTDARCTWDTLQYAGARLTKGVADFDVAAPEIVLKDLQATYLGAALTATGAYDTDAGLISRGRVWMNNFSAREVAARLPDALRQHLPPGGLDGTLSARVFLSESTRDHIAAHVELACDDQLRYFRSAPATPVRADTLPDLALQRFNLSGTATWNYRPDSPLEISHGRLVADDFLIYSGTPDMGIDFNSIKADFTFASGIARLIDFYADLAGENDGSLEAEAAYAVASRSFESASLSVRDADLSMLDPWLPEALSGELSFDVQGSGSAQAAEAELTAGLSPAAGMETRGTQPGTLTLTSADGATLHVMAHYDGKAGTLKLEQTQLGGISKLQADAGFIAWLRNACGPADGSGAASVFDALKAGGIATLDKATFDGTLALDAHGSANGTLGLQGAGVQVAGDPSPLDIKQLVASAEVLIPFDARRQSDLQMTHGQLRAASLAFGDRPLTNLSGHFGVQGGKAIASGIALTFDEGSIAGDATVATSGDVEALHLDFHGVNQQMLTESLFPGIFTAQGAISGSLSLDRTGGNKLAGSLTLTGDAPGRLKVSRDVSSQTFAPAAKAAAQNVAGALLPDDFDQIVINQLADYPYQTGRAVLQDSGKGLSITLNYNRVPLKQGEPGYATTVTVGGQKIPANLEFNLRGMSLTVDSSLPELLKLAVGLREQVLSPTPAKSH